jgi:hypothetical protein
MYTGPLHLFGKKGRCAFITDSTHTTPAAPHLMPSNQLTGIKQVVGVVTLRIAFELHLG